MQYNLNDLRQKAFGFVAPPYPVGGTPDPTNFLPVKPDTFKDLINGKPAPQKDIKYPEVTSLFGAKILMPMWARRPGDEEWYLLPNEPIVSIDAKKEIVRTTLNRGKDKKGTVKEEFNTEDYSISIEVIAISADRGVYPEFDVKMIRDLFEKGSTIEVRGLMFGLFNIREIVIESLSVKRAEKMGIRWQPISIKAYSDEDFDLEILEL